MDLIFIKVSLGFMVAAGVPCIDVPPVDPNAPGINERLVQFTCPPGQYNQMASLMVNAYDSSIALLYNSGTDFTLPVLFGAAVFVS
jgi:hypothetical protein